MNAVAWRLGTVIELIDETREMIDRVRKTAKYRYIEASIRELGLIEPLVAFPQLDTDGCFMLLDGHVRLMILRELGWPGLD